MDIKSEDCFLDSMHTSHEGVYTRNEHQEKGTHRMAPCEKPSHSIDNRMYSFFPHGPSNVSGSNSTSPKKNCITMSSHSAVNMYVRSCSIKKGILRRRIKPPRSGYGLRRNSLGLSGSSFGDTGGSLLDERLLRGGMRSRVRTLPPLGHPLFLPALFCSFSVRSGA